MPVRRTLAAGLAATLAAAGCGGSPAPHAKAPGDQPAVKSVVTSLFFALSHQNFKVACDDYTPRVRTLVVQAAQQLTHGQPSSCVIALDDVAAALPDAFPKLGTPLFDSVKISGARATVTITVSAPANQTAHSTFVVVRQGGAWKVDQSASLKFSATG
jgi:hypothetical protein